VSAADADYYDLLGVQRDADGNTIRKAFHAAAREVHPDLSDAPDAERRFRALAEAYSVLSKPEARLLYDRFGYRGPGNGGFDGPLWEARDAAPRGESVHVPVELHAYEAAQGGSRLVSFDVETTCEVCNGAGKAGDEPDPGCPECGGTGRQNRISHVESGRILQVETCPACTGKTCEDCGGRGHVVSERALKVRIPAGVEDGLQLRVRGEGHAGGRGSVPGDLILEVAVRPAPRDPRLVRYLSRALFVLAVAILVGYLLLR
jgi:molecular chaperone DnaJ